MLSKHSSGAFECLDAACSVSCAFFDVHMNACCGRIMTRVVVGKRRRKKGKKETSSIDRSQFDMSSIHAGYQAPSTPARLYAGS